MRIRYSISEKWNKSLAIKAMYAIEFAIAYYDLKDDKATLTVKLQNGNDEDAEADASMDKKRRYEIRLNRAKLNHKNLLKAIFHEMTHVKQFVFDGFKFRGAVASYRNQEYSLSNAEDYYLSPWEMEARAMEEALEYFYENQQ